MNRSTRFAKTVSIVGLILIACFSCSQKAENNNSSVDDKYVSSIKSFDEFKSIVDTSKGTLLVFDLYADWCGPCKLLAPTFNAIAATHSDHVRFYRVNVDKNPDIASAFNTHGIPYVVFVRDKEAVHAITGLNPREAYEQVITACGSATSNENCKENLKNSL